jgi:uncharacterized membrane protein
VFHPRLASPRRRAAAGALGPWALAAAFAAVYTLDSVGRYDRGATMSWDLGLFTEAVKQYAHLHPPVADAHAPGFDLLGEHFHPILALLGPLFALAPTPVTLLVAQAVLFALSVVPVVALARERLGSRQGYVVGAAYGMSFGVVQAVDFDFHELAFAAPLIALALLGLLRERTRLLVFACVGLMCTKEELGITVVLPLGIAWMLRDRSRWRRRTPLAAAGLAASMLQIGVLIPALNPDHVYGYLASPGTPGHTGGIEGLSQLLTGVGEKVSLLYLLGTVTAFTALFSPLALLALPDLLMRFASSNPYYWGTAYHYNSVLMPILFVAAVDGIARSRTNSRTDSRTNSRVNSRANGGGAVAGLVARFGVAGIAFAALWTLPDFALAHVFSPPPANPTHRAALEQAVSEVPAGAGVEASLDVLAPLAAKADAYWIGNTAIDPAPEYVVFDGPASGTAYTPQQMVAVAHAWHPKAVYTIVSATDGVYTLRRL